MSTSLIPILFSKAYYFNIFQTYLSRESLENILTWLGNPTLSDWIIQWYRTFAPLCNIWEL